MKPIRVGVIGLGMSGRVIHCRYFASAPDKYALVAVADPAQERQASARKEYGCAAYPDYRQMVEHHALDLVVNAAPNHLHVAISADLLRRGLNVITEKPAAPGKREFSALMEAARKAGRKLFVFQDLRFTPHFQQLRRVLDSGVLGRVLQVGIYSNNFARKWDWRTMKERGGGNLMNIATHLIDQAVLLLGADIMPRVLCRMDIANSFGDAENYVKIILTAPGRPLIDIEASSCCACPLPRYSVQGLYGGLTGGSHKMTWKYYKPDEAPPRQLIPQPLSDAEGNPTFCVENLTWYEETWEDDRDEYDVAPREYYESFYRAWSGGAPFEVDAAQVGMQMEIVEECAKAHSIVSASTG